MRCNCSMMVTQGSLVRSKGSMKDTQGKAKKRCICSMMVTTGRARVKCNINKRAIRGKGVGPKATYETTKGMGSNASAHRALTWYMPEAWGL